MKLYINYFKDYGRKVEIWKYISIDQQQANCEIYENIKKKLENIKAILVKSEQKKNN